MSLISVQYACKRVECQSANGSYDWLERERKGDKHWDISGDYHVLPLSNSLEISSTQSRHEGEYKCVAEGAGKRRTSHTGRIKIVTGKLMLL